MVRTAVLLSLVLFFGCLEVQAQKDSGKAAPHMLTYANAYAGSMGGAYPGFFGGGMYPYGMGMGMGMPYGGMYGMGMSPFSMYSAGKAGKMLPGSHTNKKN